MILQQQYQIKNQWRLKNGNLHSRKVETRIQKKKKLKMNSSGWNSKQGSTHTKRERLPLTTTWWKPMLYFGEDAPKGCKTRLREEQISGTRSKTTPLNYSSQSRNTLWVIKKEGTICQSYLMPSKHSWTQDKEKVNHFRITPRDFELPRRLWNLTWEDPSSSPRCCIRMKGTLINQLIPSIKKRMQSLKNKSTNNSMHWHI